MMLVEFSDTVRAVIEKMRGTGYSRLPVTQGDSDEIIGIAYYKDLICAVLDGEEDQEVTKYMYKPKYVPESKDVIKLLEEMQAEHVQMAIVIDEYGGTEGLITVEDIVEEIVGEIADETDDEEAMIEEIGAGVWRVNGRYPVRLAASAGWPVAETDDYETIAGWLMDEINSVPEAGEVFVIGDFQFKIERMRRNRIQIIRVERLKNSC